MVERYRMKSEVALLSAFFVSVPTIMPSGSFALTMRMMVPSGNWSSSAIRAVGAGSHKSQNVINHHDILSTSIKTHLFLEKQQDLHTEVSDFYENHKI